MRTALAFAALLALTPELASAQSSPSFLSVSASLLKGPTPGELLVRWAETGLPGGAVNYYLSGDASATYGCLAKNSQALCSEVTGATRRLIWIVTDKQTTRQTTPLDEPPPADDCASACQNAGGSLVIYQVEYGDVSVADLTNNVSAQVGGPFSYTFCNASNLKSCPPPS